MSEAGREAHAGLCLEVEVPVGVRGGEAERRAGPLGGRGQPGGGGPLSLAWAGRDPLWRPDGSGHGIWAEGRFEEP